MADPIADRIAQLLGIEPERAARTVQMLVRLIKVQTRRDGRVRVPHLGVFAHTDDGLAFEPDAALADAVNHRFSGLEPVGLGDDVDGTAWPSVLLPAPASDAEAVPKAVAPSPAADTPVVSSPRRRTRESDAPPSTRSAPLEPASASRRWAIAIGLLFLVGLAALILFFAVFDGSAERISTFFGGEALVADTLAPGEAASGTAVPADSLAADSTAIDSTTALAAPNAASGNPRIDPAQGGWTLVTGAFPSEEEARAQAARIGQALRDEPVDILIAPRTRFRYRVVVGQYESQLDAEAARRNLGDVLPADAWTLRLYPDTSRI